MKKNTGQQLVLLLCLLTCSSAIAQSPTCPSANQLMKSNIPAGVFAKSLWFLDRIRIDQRVMDNSVLLLAHESNEDGILHVQGYFWWRQEGDMRHCSEIEGTYLSENRQLELRVVRTTTKSVPQNLRFTATLSVNGLNLAGTIAGKVADILDRQSMNTIRRHRYTTLMPTNHVGNWEATKIYHGTIKKIKMPE